MAIYQDIQITVNQGVAQPDKSLYIFKGDSNIILNFKLVTPQYMLTKDMKDVLVSRFAVDNFELRLQLERGYDRVIRGVITTDGCCRTQLSQNVIQGLRNGSYSYQITLIDDDANAIMTFPVCKNKLNILDRLSLTAEELPVPNIPNIGESLVDIALVEDRATSITIFDSSGAYVNTVWSSGDVISASLLNKIENAVREISLDVVTLDKNKADKTTTDAIQNQVNNLVLGAVGDGNNAEVVQARGSYSTLNDRLNVMDDPVRLRDLNDVAFNVIRHNNARFSGKFSSFAMDEYNTNGEGAYTITASWGRCYLQVTSANDDAGYIMYNIKPDTDVKILNGESLYIDLDEAITNNEYTFQTSVLGTLDQMKQGNKFVGLVNTNGRLSGPMANSLNIPSEYIDRTNLADQIINFDKLDPAVDNKLARTAYQVMCAPITDWTYDQQSLSLTIRNLGRMYIFKGAVGSYETITNVTELTVNSNQIAYVDLDSVERASDGYLPIIIAGTPYSEGVNGSNAFIIDRKIPLVVNVNGRLSGPLVDKMMTEPSEPQQLEQEDPWRQPGIWYKMDNEPIFFDKATRTLTWEGTLLYLDRSDLPPNNSQRVKVLPGSYTFTETNYNVCYLDLNATLTYDENDPAVCIKGGPYTNLATNPDAYVAKRGQIPIAKYDAFDKGFEVINFPTVSMLDETVAGDDSEINDKMYALVTANSQVVIMRQASEESGEYYLGQVFKHSTSPSTNANIWRLDCTNIYTKSDDNEFTQYGTSIVNGGEWECALKEQGASDFMGGMAHGDEMMIDILFLLDGKPIDLSVSASYTGKKITILEHSTLNRVNTPDDIVANHVRHYEITKDDIIVTQEVEWLQSLTMTMSYLTMLPIRRTSDNTANGTYITNKGFKNKYFRVLDLPYNHGQGVYQKGVSEATIWNDGPGYQVYAKVEILESNDLPNATMAFSNAADYNKFYFDYCGDGYVTQVGEVWHNKARYVIDFKGMI